MSDKQEKKMSARERLLQGMQTAFDILSDDNLNKRDEADLRSLMDVEMRRVEKLFGFVPGSFVRGC